MKRQPQHKPRNLHACHPIMRKGGSHTKSTKAKRRADKQRFAREVHRGTFEQGLDSKAFLKRLLGPCVYFAGVAQVGRAAGF